MNLPGLDLSLSGLPPDAGFPRAATLRRWIRLALAAAPARPGGPGSRRTTEVQSARIGLSFVAAPAGRKLNLDFRGRDYATNVLTFAYGAGAQIEADIAICLPVLRREAREQGKTLRAHLAHLVVHGVLHAMGYDHEQDTHARRMQALEIAVLARLRIGDPYPAMARAAEKS